MSEKTEKSHDEKVVDDHRQMLLLSGKVSDFQIENLKKWGFVMFGRDLEKAKIDYNFLLDEGEEDMEAGRNVHAGSVTYDFFFKKPIDEEMMKKCMAMLDIWVKFMFWADTELIVKVEGKLWEA